MNLPNADAAVIPPEKLRDYLLSPTHPVGRYKAAFFRLQGYGQDSWEFLASDFRSLLSEPAVVLETTKHGTKYAVRGKITGLNSRTFDILTVRIILVNDTIPRFVTAYPED